ncbi:lipopolysaccharide biosynthesis protein [Bosea beijingensis]|uniref:lipopolysaccharide biosynthesis protein n=1 Tax=Bosea beijingensis TaxID=3068632 RepID=UPI002742768C|nr:lipopolysaccharide biosynthesis protein [Bosea sp. REN20]
MTFFRKTLLYMPAGTLGPLIQLATIVVLTHWLAPADLGLYALVVALQDLAQIATLSWWSQYVLRYLDEHDPALRARQDRTEIGVIAMAGVAQALLVAGFTIALADGPVEPGLVLSAALAGIMRALVVHGSVRARAQQQIGLHAFAQMAAPSLSLGLSLVGFALFGANLTVAFLAMALGHLLAALPLGLKLDYRRIRGGIDYPTLQRAFRYGVFTAMGAGLAWGSMQSMRFVTDLVFGAAAVGLIHVGWGIGQRIATQLSVLGTAALFPMAASRARSEGIAAGVNQLLIGGPILLALLAPATIGLAFVAEPVARLLTAPAYQEMTAAILPVAMLAGAVRAFRNHYLDELLQLTDRSRLMTALDGVEAVATVLLCGAGALLYGIQGALIGCLVAAMLATVLAFVLVARQHGPLLTGRAVFVTGAACLAMAAVLAALPKPDGLVGLIALCGLGGGTYLATYALFEHRALQEWVRGSLARKRGG